MLKLTSEHAQSLAHLLGNLAGIDEGIRTMSEWLNLFDTSTIAMGQIHFPPDLILRLGSQDLDVGELANYDADETFLDRHAKLRREVVLKYLVLMTESRQALLTYIREEWEVEIVDEPMASTK